MNRDAATPTKGLIRLRGVRVNNLKNLDLDIPHGQMLSLCGLSGSGKTSLALDTLFAEGQRRYIECFSPYTRQFLDQWEKPEADAIDGIPPAIAVTASRYRGNARTTVGTVTETIEYLRLLFAHSATISCFECGSPVTRNSPQEVVQFLEGLPGSSRFQIAFPVHWESNEQFRATVSDIQRNGFRRVIVGGASYTSESLVDWVNRVPSSVNELLVVVDRLKTGVLNESRCAESLESAFFYGQGRAVVLIESAQGGEVIDGVTCTRHHYIDRLICGQCQTEFPVPEASLFSFNSPRGACPTCEGFGSIHFLDIAKIVPDPSLSVKQGAIAPWNSPAYQHELQELIEIAEHHQFPLDLPFGKLSESQLELVWRGDRARDFGGLDGFFRWLEKRKYKMHLRVFLARWRSYRDCPECQGQRLNPLSLSYRIQDRSIADLSRVPAGELYRQLTAFARQQGDPQTGHLTHMVCQRLLYLMDVGLDYLSLGRQLRTLSSGERQRVALTRALGSNLVNLLYVLDEPSAGLHAHDLQKLTGQIVKLKQRRNTVVIVDHEPLLFSLSDRVVELGPLAGQAGGEIVFDGSFAELKQMGTTVTGQFLAGERGFCRPHVRRDTQRARIQITGARGHNLKNITVDFPLDVLCVVAGVSGSGKSTLVRQTLAPALQKRIEAAGEIPLGFDKLHGGERFDQIAVIDQSALPRISRSNAATYIKAWDEIRHVFSETADAKGKNLKPGAFSFNVEGGRCEKCAGEGFIRIDMQFMADVLQRCEQCQGKRFKAEVVQVRYRNRDVSDVLQMTVNEAFAFFRGHRKVQSRLKLLKDVGLDYLQIGQPASTLSIGEAQRLKLAAFLGKGAQKRTLFIMDQPTCGLHMADVARLLECFDALIDVGHSLIVIEHNLLMLANADHIIDLGPGPADAGGQVVATGTPEQICENEGSITGRYLKPLLQPTLS